MGKTPKIPKSRIKHSKHYRYRLEYRKPKYRNSLEYRKKGLRRSFLFTKYRKNRVIGIAELFLTTFNVHFSYLLRFLALFCNVSPTKRLIYEKKWINAQYSSIVSGIRLMQKHTLQVFLKRQKIRISFQKNLHNFLNYYPKHVLLVKRYPFPLGNYQF